MQNETVLHLAQKVGYDIKVSLLFLEDWQVRAMCQLDPLHARYFQEERHEAYVLSSIVTSIDQQRRCCDILNLVDNRPRLQCSLDVELGWADPEEVNQLISCILTISRGLTWCRTQWDPLPWLRMT